MTTELLEAIPRRSLIVDNLWTGSLPMPGEADDFDAVVSVCSERYKPHSPVVVLYAPFKDCPEVPSVTYLATIARSINALTMRGRVLVHCRAGLNRSGLVTALALVDRGMSGEDAVALLRKQRHEAVLCNEVFERFLLTHGKVSV